MRKQQQEERGARVPEILDYLSALLDPHRFNDVMPNGLQVQGKERIARLATGVSASLDVIEAARDWNADALLVHHGLFFHGMDPRPIGWMGKRLGTLLRGNINLFAYHLPLDAHPHLGNNAQIAQQLGLRCEHYFGEQNLGCLGTLHEPISLADFQNRAEHVFGRAAICIGDAEREVSRIAWCSGGAQSFFQAAIESGAEVYLTGEISEYCTHLAHETGVAFLSCGHHATERGGVQALGGELAERFGLTHRFFDSDNPA